MLYIFSTPIALFNSYFMSKSPEIFYDVNLDKYFQLKETGNYSVFPVRKYKS